MHMWKCALMSLGSAYVSCKIILRFSAFGFGSPFRWARLRKSFAVPDNSSVVLINGPDFLSPAKRATRNIDLLMCKPIVACWENIIHLHFKWLQTSILEEYIGKEIVQFSQQSCDDSLHALSAGVLLWYVSIGNLTTFYLFVANIWKER